MTMQSDNRGRGLANNLTAQLTVLAIAVVVVLLLAWRYIW